MKKSIINYQGVSKQVTALIEQTQNSIIAAMQAQNIRAISFVCNGDNSNFDIPRAYILAFDEEENDYAYKEIIGVFHDDYNLFVITDNILTMEELSYLEKNIFYSMDRVEASFNTFKNALNISDGLNPTETTLELAESIEIVLNSILNGKRITKNIPTHYIIDN